MRSVTEINQIISASIAQSVEHFHGKEGVISSNLIGSSILDL